MKTLKNTIIITLLLLISIVANAQSKQITLTAKNTPIKEVFAEIQQKSGYRILYNDEVVADELRVSVNVENVSVSSLLKLILENTDLGFVAQSKNLIVITRKEFIPNSTKIYGKITDENDEPLAFAKIMLYALPDTSFVAGVSTSANGLFSLQNINCNNCLVEISYVGFKKEFVVLKKNNLGTIRLTPDENLLEDVEVTAHRQLYKMEADGIRTNVEGTVLSRLGTANDILAQLPFVKGEDGNFSVFGRGKPLVYINNRLMRDNNELRQLNSANIKDVKLILTPGSRYDASVGSVIHITTVKSAGEGLSGQLYGYIYQRRLLSHYEYINLNYRKKGWDIFGTLSFRKYAYTQNQEDENTLYLNTPYSTQTKNKQISNNLIWSGNVGINYAFTPKHLIGMRYNYSKIPKGTFYIPSELHHYINGVEDTSLKGKDIRNMTSESHYLNIYYHKEFKNNVLFHFEGDLLKGNRTNEQSTDFENTNNSETFTVENSNISNYSLYAGKAFVETPLFGGKMTIGSDVSFTDNKQDYRMLTEDLTQDLPSNNNNAIQQLIAGFASYERMWNKFTFSAGLRYEHINFEYYLNGKRSDEQSRVYNNLFPVLSLNYNINNVNMSLGYRTIVNRPNYTNLRSSIAYNNPYAYEGGNPSLLPMYTNKLSYLFGWKDVQAEISYSWIKDNLLFVGKQFRDKPISLSTMVNLPESQRFDTYLSYSPKIAWWKPTFSIGVHKQNLIYEGRAYNKPYISYKWNNLFDLPGDFLISVNMRGNLEGHSDVLLYKSNFRADIRINKQLLDKKLSVSLFATDIFATDLERWSIFTENRLFNKWNDGDNRGVYLIVSYKFNTTRSKYKGQGAANEERGRL